jgi:hypothetical protein
MSDRITIPLRLAPELHARLKALADRDQRSLNAFIALALSRLVGAALPSVQPVVAPPSAARPVVAQRFPPKIRKARPNEPCPCGSGTKYKRCHGRVKGA